MRTGPSAPALAYGASVTFGVSALLVAGANCDYDRTAPVLGLAFAGFLTFAFAQIRRPGQSVVAAFGLASFFGLITVLAAYVVALERCFRISF